LLQILKAFFVCSDPNF